MTENHTESIRSPGQGIRVVFSTLSILGPGGVVFYERRKTLSSQGIRLINRTRPSAPSSR